MTVPFDVVIPARYASTRLPGKVLLGIGGKPMVQWVYEHARESGARRVVIATDDEQVAAAASAFGAEVIMTLAEHRSGTERAAQAVTVMGSGPQDIIVNVQADEPLMPGSLMRAVAEGLEAHPQCPIATLCEPITSERMLFDPNAVKVVRDRRGHALYFTRAPVPWIRDAFQAGERAPTHLHQRHIGIYAYRASYLEGYVRQPASALETAESLEQLRALDAGDAIYVGVADADPGPGIDTPEDLALARALVSRAVGGGG